MIKIMTYNVLHFENINTGKIDYDAFALTVRKESADIVFLNEIYSGQEKQLAGRLGYYSYFAFGYMEDGKPFGNGIISAFPLYDCETIAIPDPEIKKYDGYYEPRCVLACRAQTGEGELKINVAHFGLNPDEQENAVKILAPLIYQSNYILAGDFNVRPDNKILSLIRSNLIDTEDYFDEEKYSFPSDKPNRKIDYIFTSRDVSILSADIPEIIISDHRPVTAEIEISGSTV